MARRQLPWMFADSNNLQSLTDFKSWPGHRHVHAVKHRPPLEVFLWVRSIYCLFETSVDSGQSETTNLHSKRKSSSAKTTDRKTRRDILISDTAERVFTTN